MLAQSRERGGLTWPTPCPAAPHWPPPAQGAQQQPAGMHFRSEVLPPHLAQLSVEPAQEVEGRPELEQHALDEDLGGGPGGGQEGQTVWGAGPSLPPSSPLLAQPGNCAAPRWRLGLPRAGAAREEQKASGANAHQVAGGDARRPSHSRHQHGREPCCQHQRLPRVERRRHALQLH